MNSLLMAANFAFESIGKYMQNRGESKAFGGGVRVLHTIAAVTALTRLII
jgi:hypothetical protein